MIKTEYWVIGVMSGTSLDGLDLAYIKFNFDNFWTFEILKAETINYSEQWRNTLRNLVSKSLTDLERIDNEYTTYLAISINSFIKRYSLKKIHAICSHGHTALHQPEEGITYQIGNKRQLSTITGKMVVCDFRLQDVKLGGQGAPLVPIGDELLFSKYDYCLNLGGFANISTKINSDRIAYDICPVNIVLNYYVKRLGVEYDNNGVIAASGQIKEELLLDLNALDFYSLKPPKSLGLEWVNETVFPLIDKYDLSIEDILRTYIEHIAYQIVKEINISTKTTILITGGGVYNLFLIDRIKSLTKNTIIIPSRTIIEYKEALIFGLLGVLRLRNEYNCLRSVTGATINHSSGKIFQA
ncbi:anhydro-N-acetylmuramic acid kinase [Pontimicrobium aquaticum]|uniref:Anhydro-N-acetylmuramic acid kinase n=1 Tax=Pontimicrobium aquaticum TaxID=2565367 RepID=A0A4V5LQT0_9FLAO|nr:anhydro-N-acetylmuramic acid kinase [Pontimicrobium aquaticum]TJY36539.1 anhydro-N-acetylmuramic acid kinase [Pontimicrobium aquaticum]